MRNCIVDGIQTSSSNGLIQFGGGSHTNCLFEFNLFRPTGGGDFFYAGGGPWDGLTFQYNLFNGAMNRAVFWGATYALVDGLIKGNEFDGTVGGIPGSAYYTFNIGNAGNLQISENYFHDMKYTPLQVGIINGSITNNTFQRLYPYPNAAYTSANIVLWGGMYGTTVSTNVQITGNTIYYNDIPGQTIRTHGIRLSGPDTGGQGIDASTIHIENNDIINGGIVANAYAVINSGDQSTYVDAEYNYWGASSASEVAAFFATPVDYDPWWANEARTLIGSNAPIENVTQNLFYENIQDAIDAADDFDEIRVKAGVFDQTMNFQGKLGISITGAGEASTIFKPSTSVPWNYFGHTTGRKAGIRIVESNGITISGITLDCDLIKNNGWYGVFSGNSNVLLQNSTFKNMYNDQSHYYDIMIYARALSPFTVDNRAILSVFNCKLIDTGRIGIITHDNVHSIINGNQIYKTTDSFGYGIEVGSTSTAVITGNTIYGFDTPAVSDNSTSGGIYIENAFTSGITSAIVKPVTISFNNVYDCQIGLVAGNQFNNYAGNVDIDMQIANNTFVNNIDYGIMITDEDKSNGSSVTAVLTNNTISSTLETQDAVGLLIYAIGDGDLNVSMVDNVVTGYDYGLYVYDWGTYMNSSFVLYATGNTFSNADYGLYTGMVNWVLLRLDNPYLSGNTFEDNTVHVDNSAGQGLNMDEILSNNTFIGGAYKFDQIIYSSSADIVYVDADDNLIRDAETQIYSVKALSITDLRSFTAQIKLPKTYFAQPSNFAIGPQFAAYPEGTFFLSPLIADANYWIYNVTGAYLGGYDGIDGADVVLFTFSATSNAEVNNTPDGCMIEIPYDMLQLRDDLDPYNSIACLATEGMNVIIDSIEPEMEHLNSDEYPSGYLLHVLTDGSGAIDRPYLELGFSDNYDLGSSMFLIQGEALDPPTEIDFSLALLQIDGEEDGDFWQLPLSVNTLLDGTYTVYFLVIDEAGNTMIYDWDFIKDTTAPEPIVWDAAIPCRTTPRQNNAIDLKWANPVGTVKNHIWIKSYASLPDASGYPEYAPASDYTVPLAPNPYNLAEQNGWEQFSLIDPPAMPYRLEGMERGYYYITIFAEDASGNISTAPINPYYRESISYWPGDVIGIADGVLHTVNGADIAAMSPKWGLIEGNAEWNNIMDVGPTVNNGRRSRPTPDNVIDIEDLMIYAMNYNNTVYTYYQRDGEEDEMQPIRIDMQYATSGDKLFVELYLGNNEDCVRGLNIPIQHGSDLRFVSLISGDVWPEGSMLLHKDKDNLFVFTGTVLGDNGAIIGNGLIATVVFSVAGTETGIELQHMIARGIMNQEVEILNNPNDVTTPNEDPINTIPVESYLGNNFPNPFNPSTTIQYGLNSTGNVRVTIYNSRGQLVRTLVNTTMPAGTHTVVWNGKDNANRVVSSGIYFIRMETRDGILTRKALMLK